MKETARYEVQPKSEAQIITYHFTDHAKIWRHWHEYLEIIYLVHGEFTLKADKKVFRVTDGDIVVFNPFEVHESIELSKQNEYYVFIIPPEWVGVWQDSDGYQFENVIRGNRDCLHAIRKAASCVDEPAGEMAFMMHSEIFALLYHAAKHFAKPTEKAVEFTEKKKHMVEDIKNRISYCYAEPITIELLANAFFVSASHLQHTFKEQTGYSIMDYINKTRIENSKKLLSETQLHISVIAEKVGIFDYNYFSRVFKKYVGVSPTEYRKNNT